MTTEPVSTPTPRSVPVEAPGPRATASATATPSASRNPNSDHVSPAPADLQRTSDTGASATDIDPTTWREFRPDDSDTDRPFEHISPVEIANAWRIIAARSPQASLDETRRSVLQAFGRRKMTRGIAAHLARAEALV